MARQKMKKEIPKPRKLLSDEEKVNITLDRFAPLREGRRPKDLKSLRAEYGRDPAIISKAIQDAFQEQLVELVRVEKAPSAPRRLDRLETALRDKFANLRAAMVIESPPVPEAQEGDPKALVWDDEVHRNLGEGAAQLLSTGALLRDGDVVGVGSGRGVYYTVDALTRLPPLRVSGVTLVSLTGALYARDHGKRLNARLDADFHVSLLGLCIEHAANLRLVTHPLAYSNHTQLLRDHELTYLGAKQWQESPPAYALLGVGVLGPGHRLYDATLEPDPILAPIDAQLKKLIMICDRWRGPTSAYWPVADVCNHLFYLPPPKSIRMPEDTHREIIQLIADVNGRLLNVRADQLETIQHVVLVAGARKKAAAIGRLLSGDNSVPDGIPKMRIEFLCTDSRTAEELIKEEQT
jgi:DNA-binding transcriptional regulator LsrR (DeoR family)